MNIIVLDLEWNQSSKQQTKDTSLPFEIIEIGAVKLDENRRVTDRFSQLIKPQIYHKMHHMTENIIHIPMEELEKGRIFQEVFEQFREWCGKEYIFATWGPLDLLELQRNIKYYGLVPISDGPIRYYDVQKLFSLAFLHDKTRKTLEFAIDYFHMNKDVPFHRAYSDAYYTARVFEKIVHPDIMQLISFDTFQLPKDKKSEIKIIFPGYAKYISREFGQKQEVMQDKEVSSTTCYLCRRNLRKKIRWYTRNGKNFYSAANCEIHGTIRYKVRVRKSEEKHYYAVKTSKFITEEALVKMQEESRRSKKNQKSKSSNPH